MSIKNKLGASAAAVAVGAGLVVGAQPSDAASLVVAQCGPAGVCYEASGLGAHLFGITYLTSGYLFTRNAGHLGPLSCYTTASAWATATDRGADVFAVCR
jgi:hypothetical protein